MRMKMCERRHTDAIPRCLFHLEAYECWKTLITFIVALKNPKSFNGMTATKESEKSQGDPETMAFLHVYWQEEFQLYRKAEQCRAILTIGTISFLANYAPITGGKTN